MRGLKSIAVICLVALMASVASAQRRQPPPPPNRGGDRAGQGRFSGVPQRRDNDQRPSQQQQNDQGTAQPGGRRFVPLGPGPHMGDWLRKHEDMPADQQEKALENDPTFRQLPPDRQQRLRQRLDNFNRLPQDQRDRMLQRMEIFEHLSPQQQQNVRDMSHQFRDLPADRKRALVQGFRDLEGLSPADRQRLLDSDTYRKNFSPQELQLLRGMSEVGITPRPPQ